MRGLVEYPVPLGEGDFAYVRLPAALKTSDIERVIAVIRTLAPDDSLPDPPQEER